MGKGEYGMKYNQKFQKFIDIIQHTNHQSITLCHRAYKHHHIGESTAAAVGGEDRQGMVIIFVLSSINTQYWINCKTIHHTLYNKYTNKA